MKILRWLAPPIAALLIATPAFAGDFMCSPMGCVDDYQPEERHIPSIGEMQVDQMRRDNERLEQEMYNRSNTDRIIDSMPRHCTTIRVTPTLTETNCW